MNISLICHPTTDNGKQTIKKRFKAAIKYIEQYFPASEAIEKHSGDTIAYNSESLGETWKTSCTYEDHTGFYSVSQPAIPVEESVDEANYWSRLSRIVQQKKFDELLPNHFGIKIENNGDALVWSDHWGLGRCYIVDGDIIAISNHIGVLAFFLDTPLTIDRAAVAKYAGSSFYFGDETPYKQIRKAEPSSLVRLQEGRVSYSKYARYEALFERTTDAPDFDGAAHQLTTVARNISSLAHKTPAVSLSGGRDSRMTTAVMLSAGLPLTVKTINTWPEETDIAKTLLALFRQSNPEVGIEHQIVEPKSAKVTQSLEERLRRAFIMWDGDAVQNRFNSNVSFPRKSNRLNIGGVSGEIMRGVYYGRDGQLEKFEKTDDFLRKRFPSLLGAASLSTEARAIVDSEVERILQVIEQAGWANDVRGFDVLYFVGKNSNWPPQALNAHSPIILSAPAFIRTSFNLSKDDKVGAQMVPELLKRTIPDWTGVPTFKATGQKSRESFNHGTATFQTDPEGFYHFLRRRSLWPAFFDEAKMDLYMDKILSGEQRPAEVAWLNKAIWIEYLEEHTAKLNNIVAESLRQ